MSIEVTCDGCGKVEKLIREDICAIAFWLDDVEITRDYCAPCQATRTAEIKKILNEK